MIYGKRVVIRPLEIGDEEYLYQWWNDGHMMGHAGFHFGTLQSKESIRRNIMHEIENYNLFPERKRFIICTKEDMQPIGEMNYCDWNARNQKCEFGIKICEVNLQGQGYGQDALYHFIDYLFRTLNLNKLELTSMADNERAHRLYKKLGFKQIGVVREGFFDSRTGSFRDVVYMDLLKREWLEVKSGIRLD